MKRDLKIFNMKNKLYQNLETVATISWLLMDFCWMSKYILISCVMALIALTFSCCSIFFYKGKSKSETCMLSASFFWILMNSTWMCADIPGEEYLIDQAKIYFVISLIMVIIALIIAKIENEKVDFKRLKLK